MKGERRFHWYQLLIDVVLFLSVGLPLLLTKLFVRPYQRGFYCDDDSIRYPFHESTVSSLTLEVFGCGLPILTIFLNEILTLWLENRHAENTYTVNYYLGRKRLHRYLIRVYKYAGYFMFGAVVCELLTNVGKLSVGRLRPNFISVCRPTQQIALFCANNNHTYIEPIICDNTDTKNVDESRVSFPSGHSSFSFYCAIYVAIYLEARARWPRQRVRPFFKPIIQTIFLCMATGCALSRISDYKHHPTDVLTGSLLGIFSAYYTTVKLGKFFKKNQKMELKKEDDYRHEQPDSSIQNITSLPPMT